jgi:LAO/AO transport system kinase
VNPTVIRKSDTGSVRSVHRRAVDGDRNALARLLTVIESEPATASPAVWSNTGDAQIIGITGPAGAGKSTLTSALLTQLRGKDLPVAVLAVDPSSPYTGGAVLGDRLRMARHTLDPGVFMRSISARGHHGGLAASVPLAIRALESAGFAYVLIETVGVGQAEIDIVKFADTVVVVLAPGWGDGVQAMKAGLLEIADILVVNKADRPGLAQTTAELRALHTQVRGSVDHSPVSIVETVATDDKGLPELLDALSAHRDVLLQASGALLRERRGRAAAEHIRFALGVEMERRRDAILDSPAFAHEVTAVTERKTDPWTAALRLIITRSPEV